MIQKRFFIWGAAFILVLVAALVSIRVVIAQIGPDPAQEEIFPQFPSMGSASYYLDWDVMANGGGVMTSTSYRLRSTLGQDAIGKSSSVSYSLHAGYWQLFNNYLYLPLIRR